MGGPVPNSAIGPGLGAFLAFFALAVALYFLLRSMNARMRRMAYRERDRLAALAAAESADAAGKAGTAGAQRAGGSVADGATGTAPERERGAASGADPRDEAPSA